MLKQRVVSASVIAVFGLLGLLVMVPAAQATDASVPPVKVDGNPTCADYGLTTVAKFDPVESGTINGVTLVKHGEYYVKWTSTVGIDWVIVKGGPNANIYKYSLDSFGDDWLHAPMNGKNPYGLSHVEFCSDGSQEPTPKPGISVVKDGPASASVGSQVTFTFKVTNTGGVVLTDPVVTDNKCAPVTKVPDGDTQFNPGDVWDYTCTMTITDAMGDKLINTVKACGKDGETKVCDEDDHTTTIPKGNPPGNPPVDTPPGVTPPSVTPGVTPNPGTTPSGGVLPDTIVSGRARLRGPSGCVKQAFRARVSGRSIASVTFFVDGRKVKTVRRGAFSLKVNPAKYGLGRHKIVALVRFRAESGTKARRLPLTFRRCAQGAVAPRFTG